MSYPHAHTCVDCPVRYRPCLCEWDQVERVGRCPGCLQDHESDISIRLRAMAMASVAESDDAI